MVKVLRNTFCCVFTVIFLICNLCGCSNFKLDFLKLGSDDAQFDEQRGVETKALPYTTFFYDQLSDREKTCYKEILSSLQKKEEKTKISVNDKDTIDKIYYCVLNDHPEIFYVSGYKIQQGKDTHLSGNYLYSKEEIASRQKKIDEYVSRCFSQMPSNADDYGKVKYIYEYIVKNTDYESQKIEDQNVCSVFISGKSVCMGYSRATQYLLNCLGINTILVTGFADIGVDTNTSYGNSNENHAWNEVFLNGNWYCVDTTWGGGFSKSNLSKNGEKLINYDYLLATTDEFNISHKTSKDLKVPVCTHCENNYFVREGAYFEKADLNQFSKLVGSTLKQKKRSVSIKCKSREVYDDLKRLLFDEGKVRNYIPKENGSEIYTSCSDKLLTLTVFF